jgi:hypothetical protein
MVEAESHVVRLKVLEQEGVDKTTKRLYDRALQNYCIWWDQNQARVVASNLHLVTIPALPITAAKVVLFLQYEMTREKKKVCIAFFLSHTLLTAILLPFFQVCSCRR